MKINKTTIYIVISAFMVLLFVSAITNQSWNNLHLPGDIPVKPNLPSKDPDDYVQALQYIFSTGDSSLLEEMIGPQGTALHFPYGVGFNFLGENNLEDVQEQFKIAQNKDAATCIGLYPAKSSKFTVIFENVQFDNGHPNSVSYFLFWKNEQGYWELVVMGYGTKEAVLYDASPCPEIEFSQENLPAATQVIESTPNVQTSTPINIGCAPRRGAIDNHDDFIQCTEYASQVRPDALCWLRKNSANAQFWNDDALTYGSEIVVVDYTPMEGDIVVFEPGCQGTDAVNGHVAIVTYVSKNTNGEWIINLKEANANGDGEVGVRNEVPVESCMSFIHQPGFNINISTENPTTIPEAQPSNSQTELTWWQALFCFFQIGKCE